MNRDRLYIQHILDCIEKIERFTSGGKDEFLNNELIRDAVLRNLQIMAESTQKLSDELKSVHPEIEWNALSGFRNILVHAYLDINLNRVWQSIEKDLPALKIFAVASIKSIID